MYHLLSDTLENVLIKAAFSIKDNSPKRVNSIKFN